MSAGCANSPAGVSHRQAARASLTLLFVAVYGSCNYFTGLRSSIGTFYFEWEHAIPFVPRMILPFSLIAKHRQGVVIRAEVVAALVPFARTVTPRPCTPS